MEHIKPIPGFEGYYADKKGNVYSAWPTGRGVGMNKQLRKLRPAKWKNGYSFLNLRIAKNTYYATGVHRLVCAAFYGLPPKDMTASHLDGDRGNNHATNLMWESQLDNLKRKIAHGTSDRGYNNSRAKIDKKTLISIRKDLTDGKYTQKAIGEKYGLGRAFITKIHNGYRYKDC